MSAKTLMVLGTMSSAGKSLLVTGLCRLYARRGWRVVPFKAQNMSNNAAVCSGGEIGRAQAVQAQAAGVAPTVAMNPILLKPEADNRSQVVVRGKVWGAFTARDYYPQRDVLWQVVSQSLDELRQQADLVVMEGAGSPVELNLKGGDIVNLAAARYAEAPCLLAGDIDRGGIFAQLLGTQSLLDEAERPLLKGFIINKFRGDLALFQSGVELLESRSGLPVLGVVPYLHNHGIADEDAAGLSEHAVSGTGRLDLAVIWLPHISNFDDVDPLRFETDVQVRFVRRVEELGRPRAILLPGTKSTLSDLAWLHDTGLAQAICARHAQGASVVGLCGGFQMLGIDVRDPQRVESSREQLPGLNLLATRTVFSPEKTVTRSRAEVVGGHGFWEALRGQALEGYEIHMGQTDSQAPLLRIVAREGAAASAVDGACSADGTVFGAYLHGWFENDLFRRAWLASLGARPSPQAFADYRAEAYDRLADVLASSINLERLDRIIEQGLPG
jgi:adenosylcobyric acid synthase